MTNRVVDDTTMTQYLLGLLSEEEREQVETAFFQDDACFEQLASLEDDLIDDYVRGRLKGDIQIAFEKKLRTDPNWKERVMFAQALTRRITESKAEIRVPVKATPAWLSLLDAFRGHGLALRWAGVACGVALVASVSWLTWQLREQRADMESLKAERNGLQTTIGTLENQIAGLREQDQNLSRELDQERAKRQELETRQRPGDGVLGLMASFVLTAGTVRGADETPRLVVPKAARTAQFQLDLETVGEYPSYRIMLRTATGNLIWSLDRVRARANGSGEAVTIQIPSQLLSSGEYELSLLGLVEGNRFEEAAYYYFNVQ